MLFTTSWDDGYALDLKLADLLDAHGVKGTFYICPRKQHDALMLSESEIATLRERHEIGAHTLRHPKLTQVPAIEAKQEIEDSKAWVENSTGSPCSMFCYPFGDVNANVQDLVREAGFKGARTTKDLHFNIVYPLLMHTSLQVIPFPRRKSWSRWWHPLDPFGPLRVRYRRLRKLGIKAGCLKSWSDLAICLFDYAKETDQSFFHVWGHSREIEKYGMWNELEIFLKHVQESGVRCDVNSALIR